ncbi:Replication factor C subunit 5 [Venturia inaequalis]|nr:Replication factor C subunit 5 [Venturia inaequalis]
MSVSVFANEAGNVLPKGRKPRSPDSHRPKLKCAACRTSKEKVSITTRHKGTGKDNTNDTDHFSCAAPEDWRPVLALKELDPRFKAAFLSTYRAATKSLFAADNPTINATEVRGILISMVVTRSVDSPPEAAGCQVVGLQTWLYSPPRPRIISILTLPLVTLPLGE